MKRYKLFDISWDTDGLDIEYLPSEVNVDVEDDCDIAYEGADILSDQYGWCVNCFNWEEC